MLVPTVIYEADDFLVIDKPSGLLVHQVRVGDSARRRRQQQRRQQQRQQAKNKSAIVPESLEALTDWLRQHYPSVNNVGDEPVLRPGIVHRLDKETSGVMLVAKTQRGFDELKLLFQSHEIHKTYTALLYGTLTPPQGSIQAAIGIKSGTTKRSVFSHKMLKEAQTDYRTRESLGRFSLVEAKPRTGRTHQLRVHFAYKGHPIVGDKLYAPKTLLALLPAPRLMLHAFSLEFALRGQAFSFEAPLPADFKEIVKAARLQQD